jgi:hypothetical protein
MNRSTRFKVVSRSMALLFMLIAVFRIGSSAATWVDPLYGAAALECEPCQITVDPVRLLASEQARIRAWRTPGSEARIRERVQAPRVRTMLFAAEMVRAVPLSLLFLSIALALNSFASGGFSIRAVRWLRRASLAGVFWILSQPVSESIRSTALSPITEGREAQIVVLVMGPFFWAVMVVAATWVCLRAMEDALALRRDLEEIV